MQVISEKTYKADQVTYMSDKLGLHRISNPHKEDFAVSLHCESKMLRHDLCADNEQCTPHLTQRYTAVMSSTKPTATPHTWLDAQCSPSMEHLSCAKHDLREHYP
jgi:hypothetical protein